MNKTIKLGVILMIYSAIAGVVLGYVYSKAKPEIEKQKELERKSALFEVLPPGVVTIKDTILSDGTPITVGYADSLMTDIVGYAIVAEDIGFSGKIRTLVGIRTDFSINAIKVIEQSETPGLGTKAQTDSLWRRQFVGKTVSELVIDKDGGQIQAITGSTITTRAVVNPVRKMIEKLQSMSEELSPNIIDTLSQTDTLTRD